MSKLTFRRSEGGTSSLQLDDGDPLELQPDQLMETLSTLSTNGSSLQVELDGKRVPRPSHMGAIKSQPKVTPPPWKRPEFGEVSYTKSAREHALQAGLTNEQVLWAMDDPDIESMMDNGRACALVRGDIGLKVFLDTDTIFGVYEGDVLRRQIAEHERKGDRRRTHGGNGGRYPTTMGDLISALRDAGCGVEMSNSGHHRVEGPASGRFIVLPSTPSDHRSLMNSIKMAEKELGISLRRQ